MGNKKANMTFYIGLMSDEAQLILVFLVEIMVKKTQ